MCYIAFVFLKFKSVLFVGINEVPQVTWLNAILLEFQVSVFRACSLGHVVRIISLLMIHLNAIAWFEHQGSRSASL